MLTIIVFITGVSQLILALFVYSKRRNNLTNILFSLLIITTMCWALTNYSVTLFLDSSYLVYAVRGVLFFVVVQNALFYLFARTFPSSSWNYSKKWLYAYGIFTALAATATLSPWVFTSVAAKDGLPITVVGPAILIFIMHAVLSTVAAFSSLIKKLGQSIGVQKDQLRLLLLASFLNWVVVPITNFAIKPLLQTTIFIIMSPIYTLAFASIIAYAIIFHKLFDIRAATARALAYILSLGTLAATYALIIFGVTEFFYQSTTSITTQRAFYVVLAVLSSLTYQPLKRFFDKVTDRIFFRNSYDSQKVLDQLGNIVVNKIKLKSLLVSSQTLLMGALKPEFIECVLINNLGNISYTEKTGGSKKDPGNLIKLLSSTKEPIIIIDMLEDEPRRPLLGAARQCQVHVFFDYFLLVQALLH